MSRIEAERLAEDVARVWGPAHPYLRSRGNCDGGPTRPR
jgi:hypothetical protein